MIENMLVGLLIVAVLFVFLLLLDCLTGGKPWDIR